MKEQRKLSGMTLVELIVVVMILAILGTIGFISLGNIIGYVKDTTDTSNIKTIERSIDRHLLKGRPLPLPTNPVDLTYSGTTLIHQGVLGNDSIKYLSEINNEIYDQYGKLFTYSIDATKRYFEIAGVVAKDTAQIDILGNTTYAAQNGGGMMSYVAGNYNNMLLTLPNGSGIHTMYHLPSLIFSGNSTSIETLFAEGKMVIDGASVFPPKYSEIYENKDEGTFTPTNFIVFSDKLTYLNNNEIKEELLKKIQGNYLASSLGESGIIEERLTNLELDSELAGGDKLFMCSLIRSYVFSHAKCENLTYIESFIYNSLSLSVDELPSNINTIFVESDKIWFGTNGGVTLYENTSGSFTTFSKTDGLVNNNVNAIAKDGEGYYWIGTVNGISRFDGVDEWVTYAKETLVATHIQFIHTGSDGTIWIATNGGANSFDGNVWGAYEKAKKKSGILSANTVTSIYADGGDYVWFGVLAKGVDRYNVNTEEIVNYNVSSTSGGLQDNKVRYIFGDSNGDVWHGTEGGLSHFDGTMWTAYDSGLTGVSLLDGEITYIMEDSGNNLWIGTVNGVVKKSGSMYEVFNASTGLAGGKVYSIYEDDGGDMIIISANGADTVDSDGSVIGSS